MTSHGVAYGRIHLRLPHLRLRVCSRGQGRQGPRSCLYKVLRPILHRWVTQVFIFFAKKGQTIYKVEKEEKKIMKTSLQYNTLGFYNHNINSNFRNLRQLPLQICIKLCKAIFLVISALGTQFAFLVVFLISEFLLMYSNFSI